MNFVSRSYNTQYSRPKPNVHFDDKNKTLAIISAWGKNGDTTPFIDSVLNFYNSKLKDSDFTSPFGFLDHLNFTENTLRTAVLLANQSFLNKFNLNEFTTGLEFCLLLIIENTIYNVSVGQPHIILKRANKLTLLSSEPDLSSDHSSKDLQFSPLPTKLLGITKNINLNIRKFHIKKEDQLILFNRSQVYPFDISKKQKKLTIETVSDFLISQNDELPFWLGLLTI